MKEKLYNYLSERNAPTASEELVQEVLAIRGAKSTIADRIIEASVNGDDRFVRDHSGCWHLASRRERPLSETPFVLCQLAPIRAESLMHIDSVACCLIKDGEVMHQKSWDILWSKDWIDEADSSISQPEVVFREISKRINDAVLVMDGFGNQYSMLNSALRWLDGTEPENDMLSLRGIAKHLCDDSSVSSHSDLSKVAELPIMETGDAMVRIGNSAEIFLSLLEKVKQCDILTVEALLEFCYPEKLTVDYSQYAFDHDFICNLPAKPGVYIMRDKSNKVIYVGKAKNLSKRLRSYFLSREQRDAKTQMILEQLYDLEIRVLGSELEALLQEQRLISKFDPSINRQLEVHSRRHINSLQAQILFLPSKQEDAVELFLIANGYVHQVKAEKDFSNLAEVETAISNVFFDNSDIREKIADTAALLLAASWLSGHEDVVTSMAMKWVPDLKTCMNRVKHHILDFGTEKVIHI